MKYKKILFFPLVRCIDVTRINELPKKGVIEEGKGSDPKTKIRFRDKRSDPETKDQLLRQNINLADKTSTEI